VARLFAEHNPNADNELRDHRGCALWLGRSHQLNLKAVGG
jgi:DOPA 4,5-dioxygenase